MSVTLCAFLMTAGGAWAASSWSLGSGKLVIDDPLPGVYLGTDGTIGPDDIGGLQQLLSGDRYPAGVKTTVPQIPPNFGTPPLTAVRELIITPNAAPGGTYEGGNAITPPDLNYIGTWLTGLVSLDCTGAKTLPNGVIGENSTKLLTSLKFLSLPDNVVLISEDAFSDNGFGSLETIILPTSVALISEDAFPSSLKTIVFRSQTPPEIRAGAFNSVNLNVVVPRGQESIYAAALLGKGIATPTIPAVASIVPSSTDLSSAGGTLTVKVTGTNLVAPITVLVSGDAYAATINTAKTEAVTGNATLPANTGTAAVTYTIAATMAGVEIQGLSATVRVASATASYNPLTNVTVSPSTLPLTIGATGNTGTLTATLVPAATTSTDILEWSVNPAGIVTVTRATNGRSATVTAVASGTATVTVKYPNSNIADTCTVTVGGTPAAPATGIAFAGMPAGTLELGKSMMLGWSLAPANAAPATVTLTSSKPSVARVTPAVTTATAGIATVTGVTGGTAVITAAASGLVPATFTVMVMGGPARTGDVNKVVLETQAPVIDKAFDVRVSLARVPASVKLEVLRPDWLLHTFTARVEGKTAWVAYTPPVEGKYYVFVTALDNSNAVVGTGTTDFLVDDRGNEKDSGGCNAGLAGLAVLALVPALKRKAK
jgi:Synergist-CTERM protein sorting domain-containing protein